MIRAWAGGLCLALAGAAWAPQVIARDFDPERSQARTVKTRFL